MFAGGAEGCEKVVDFRYEGWVWLWRLVNEKDGHKTEELTFHFKAFKG